MRLRAYAWSVVPLLACVSTSGRTNAPLGPVVVAMPERCADAPHLDAYQQSLRKVARQSLASLQIDARLIDEPRPTARAIQEALEEPGWGLLVFSGHGFEGPDKRSHVCLAPVPDAGSTTSIDALTARLPNALNALVLVANACSSASVDVRRGAGKTRSGPRYLSVISASPFEVEPGSLFGEALFAALHLAAKDPSCDGLVTDQELFDALVITLNQWFPLAAYEAFPKLRRHAPSHVPLPVRPRASAQCDRVRAQIRQWLAASGSAWGELATALKQQLALTDVPNASALPSVSKDYFVVDGALASVEEARRLEAIAVRAGLEPLPASASIHAEQLARFATFAEIYRLELRSGFVRVLRLRDQLLVATRELSDPKLACALPRRESLSYPDPPRWTRTSHPEDRSHASQLRIVGEVSDRALTAVPCYDVDGQCFALSSTRRKELQCNP